METATDICWTCLGAIGRDLEVYDRLNSPEPDRLVLMPAGYPCSYCEFLTKGYDAEI